MATKSSEFEIFDLMISSWKPRAKKIKFKLKELAVQGGTTPQHLTKIITRKFVINPRIKTINAVEMALRAAEKKAGVK
jgi:hypothetical protein